jgi:vacuolar-type H+-ATPase subunit D/Vma8
MKIKLNKVDQAKLNLTDVQMEQLLLAVNMTFDDLGSCRTINKALSDAFQILNERFASISGEIAELDDKIESGRRNALNRLFIAKHVWDDQVRKVKENKDAKKQWTDAGAKGSFVAPHDVAKFVDISDLTPVDPTKLTDSAIKAVAENAAYRDVSEDYRDLLKYHEILKSLKDTIIRIGERVNSNIMAFGVENKIAPSS